MRHGCARKIRWFYRRLQFAEIAWVATRSTLP